MFCSSCLIVNVDRFVICDIHKLFASIVTVYLSIDNSDLNFLINEDGLGGSSLSKEGFANMWAASRASWGVKGGKYVYEGKVENNIEVEMEESEQHPNALRYGLGQLV